MKSFTTIGMIVHRALVFAGLSGAIYFWLAMVGAGFWLSLLAPASQFDTTPSAIERAGYFILSAVFLTVPILTILSERRKG